MSEFTVLTREQIFAADDHQVERVSVPEWSPSGKDENFGFYVHGLSGTDRDKFDLSMLVEKRVNGKRRQETNLENLRARLIVLTAYDSEDPATAVRIFEISDVARLGRKSGAALQRAFAVAQRLSGLSADDIEEMTSELGEASSNGSGSDSPLPSGTDPLLSASAGSLPESSLSGSPSTDLNPSETNG